MHRLKCKGFDALVTPGHKFVTTTGLKPVELLLTNDKIVLSGNPAPDGPGTYDDSFVQLVGWAVTEGSYSIYRGKRKTTHYVAISQNWGAKADRIEECLEATGAHYKKHYHEDVKCGNFVVSQEAGKRIHEVAPRRVPSMDFILSLTQKQRLILVETMISGDGSKMSDSCWVYSQKDKAHFDAFVVLCTLAGMRTDAKPYDNQTPFGRAVGFRTYVQIDPEFKYCLGANIDFHGGRGGTCGRGQSKADNPNTPMIYYRGLVRCPETEYGNFVCRRNGSVYVTGNTFRDEMVDDAVENVIYAVPFFDPAKSNNPFGYFTLVAWRAFIRRIQAEQKQNYIKHKNFEKNFIESGGTTGTPNEYSREVIEKFERRLAEQKKKSKEAGLLKLAEQQGNEDGLEFENTLGVTKTDTSADS